MQAKYNLRMYVDPVDKDRLVNKIATIVII